MAASGSYVVQVFDTGIEPEDARFRIHDVVNLLALGLLRNLHSNETTNAATTPGPGRVSDPRPSRRPDRSDTKPRNEKR